MRDPKAGEQFSFLQSAIETISSTYRFFNLGNVASTIWFSHYISQGLNMVI
jgi:hypothetical protein